MVCLFCLRETCDGISISAENEREIIRKYFWFDINETTLTPQYSCTDCWTRVESFHEFYQMVESVHQSHFNENDNKNIPTIVYESNQIGDAERLIKLETGTTESCFVESNTIYIQSPSILEAKAQFEAEPTVQEPSIEWPETKLPRDKRKEKSTSAKLPFTKRAKSIKVKSNVKKPKSNIPRKNRTSIRTVNEIRCYMCDKMFATFRSLRNHFQVHDPPESRTFECDLCGKRYSRPRVLKKHMAYHIAREKYAHRSSKAREKTTCSICGKELTTGSLKSHILVQHENIKLEKPKVHICEVCGKGFSAPSLLSQHSLTHIDRQFTQVQCEICGKWIKNRDILRAHKKIHNQVPEKCPHCGKMKQSHEILRKHILVAHSIGKHQCTFCEKSFTRPKALREHIATHTGESLYDCPYCPRKFKNDANKYKHMREKHLTQWNIDRGKKAN